MPTQIKFQKMKKQTEHPQITRIKVILFLICLLPLGRLLWATWTNDFGPEPVEFVQRWTGTWTFNLLLIPLAATSNQWAIRKMGGRKWQELHRNIYLIGILAAVHYFWLTKAAAMLWPLAYAIALAALLGWRIQERRRKAIPVPQFQAAKPLKFFKQKPD